MYLNIKYICIIYDILKIKNIFIFHFFNYNFSTEIIQISFIFFFFFMNIFANIISTQNQDIKNQLKERFWFSQYISQNELEIYSTSQDEMNLVLIFGENIEDTIHYAKENYEITKFLHIWESIIIDTLDIFPGDVILPNTCINENNEVIFLESVVDKNYDLKNFWLLLNGICLWISYNNLQESELHDILQNSQAEIFDMNSFDISQKLHQNGLIEKSSLIRIAWTQTEFYKNWIDILELLI